ncbi:MAG TPA: cytochrome b N-terminal domain-containing protein [Gemmatimonadales bacterium]|nr:cytochrome b N-terminal domain-containing protein [Gemmatimonadales bacterium]
MPLLERLPRRLLRVLDAGANWCYGWRWNPFHQAGTLAVVMLLVLLGTGLYLVVYYRLGAPFASVSRLTADPWLGAWMRTLHRYATDVFVLAASVHAVRMLAQGRSWGPRTLAWVSGLLLLGAGLVCAWTGYVMVWDTFGERLALEGGRLFDKLPIFSEPQSRIFAGGGPVPSAFFFVNLFIHIALPLGLGAALWLHVSRLARPVLLPPRRITWGSIGALLIGSVLFPAPLGPVADPFRLAESTPTDVVVAWWLPISERLPAGVAWSVGLGFMLAVLLVPRLTRRPREGTWAPSGVDPRLCTGCNQCPQDCPWEAITMVGRTDDRPILVAHVDPARCVSCGICAGSCAPMGVGPPGRTGRDQVAVLRATILTDLAAAGGTPMIAVCCARAPGGHVAALRARGVRIHPVSCVGNLHSSVIELLVRAGSPGVIVCGCPPRDCAGREGPKWLLERLFHEREAELPPRVDRRRVRVVTLAPGNLGETLVEFDAFVRELEAAGRLAGDVYDDLDPECEPVPLEESAS